MSGAAVRIVTWGGMGDVILLTPALREWKRQHPRGKLVVYCMSRQHGEILERNPHIDSLRHIGPSHHWLFGLFPALRRRFGASLSHVDYGKLLPSLTYKISAVHIVGEMLGVAIENPVPELHLSGEETAQARERLSGLSTPVALHVGAMATPNKLWFTDRWQALVRECPSYTFVQVGKKDEPSIDGAVDLRCLSVRETFAAIGQCAAFAGLDSGFAHAAAALRVPAVVLFGPTTPEVWGHPRAIHLYHREPCSPCIDVLHNGRCPYDRACMRSIQVSELKAALEAHLT